MIISKKKMGKTVRTICINLGEKDEVLGKNYPAGTYLEFVPHQWKIGLPEAGKVYIVETKKGFVMGRLEPYVDSTDSLSFLSPRLAPGITQGNSITVEILKIKAIAKLEHISVPC